MGKKVGAGRVDEDEDEGLNRMRWRAGELTKGKCEEGKHMMPGGLEEQGEQG